MQQVLRLVIAAIAAIALAQFPASASAQSVKQVKLTEKQIEGFIAAQKDMEAITEKMQGRPPTSPIRRSRRNSRASPRSTASPDFTEYDEVAANISMVMAGIDPQTKAFSEPTVAIKKEIEEVKADKTIPENEKKQMLEELNEALKTAQPIQYPSNIELVKKYYDKIDAVLQ